MTRTPKRRPSPALLISILALVMAMGGSSVAQDVVADISAKIKGKRIAKNAITSKHIKQGTIQAGDIKAGVIPAPQNVDAYTKAESDGKYQGKGNYLAGDGKAVDADKLDGVDSTGFLAADGKAVDSDKLDGNDSADFMKGDAFHGSRTMAAGAAPVTLFTIADRVRVLGTCLDETPDRAGIRLEYLADWAEVQGQENGNAPFAFTSLIENGDADSFAEGAADSGTNLHLQAQLSRRGIIGSEVIDVDALAFDTGGDCRFSATAIHRDSRFTPIIIGPIVPVGP